MTNNRKFLSLNMVINSVRALMVKHGVPKMSHAETLADILQLSKPGAYKKLNATSDWTVTDLGTIENHYGVPLDLGERNIEPLRDDTPDMVEASFEINNHVIPCLAVIGPLLATKRNVDYVAYRDNGAWRVAESVAALASVDIYKVEKLEILMRKRDSRSFCIAVVDDEKNSADGLCDDLSDFGFSAKPFYQIASLERAISEQAFDAFIIDWLFASSTSEALIHTIRKEMNSAAPIFLLTGELRPGTGRANALDIARVIKLYGATFLAKPMRASIIAAEISNALGITE